MFQVFKKITKSLRGKNLGKIPGIIIPEHPKVAVHVYHQYTIRITPEFRLSRDEVLKKLSRYFEAESEEMVKGLTTAIEPLIMIVLGVGVGFLIIAVVLPIYNLTSSF